jgi:hypothetical protein
MLINCTNTVDRDDVFVINPPVILPKGTRFSYHDRYYVVEEIFYDDENGCIDYNVSPDRQRGTKGLDAKVLEFCRNNQKLQAVKYVKEVSDVGLKEAKGFVDGLCAKYGIR